MSTPSDSHAKKLTLGGAILAAIAASSCCIGPLVFAALGVGGAGAFAALAAYRPYILGVTAVLLAAGFIMTYRKPRAVLGDACGCEKPKANRAGRIGLWIATAAVVLFAAAPTLIGRVYQAQGRSTATDLTVKTETAVITVQGADCAACVTHLRSALNEVGGLHALALDVPTQSATVTYEPAPGRLAAYVAAIDALGYEATISPTRKAGSQ